MIRLWTSRPFAASVSLKELVFVFPFFDWECKSTSFFISTKFIFLIFNFLTTNQKNYLEWLLIKKRACFLIFWDCKDMWAFQCDPNFFWFFFHKKLWRKIRHFLCQPFVQNAGAKISKYLITNKLFFHSTHKKMSKRVCIFIVDDRFSKSGRKDTSHWLFAPNDLKK